MDPPDQYDQIMFSVKNTYDRLFFNLTSYSIDFAAYNSIEANVYEYSLEKSQWMVHVQIGFFNPIKFTETLFDSLVKTLINQREFQVLTALNSTGYKFKF